MSLGIIEFGQQINLNTFETMIGENPYDQRQRDVKSLWGNLEDSSKVMASLLPLDHALTGFPCRTLTEDLDQQQVKEIIEEQKRKQSDQYVFPILSLKDVPELAGRPGNKTGCNLELNGIPQHHAVFTYRRCGLGFIAIESKLEAAFWRAEGEVFPYGNPFSWTGMKMKNVSRDFNPPILPAKLLVLSQGEIANGKLALRFS